MINFIKKIFSKNLYILILIVFIAAFLRFYQLGSNPPSLTWDEASWGYNSYSLGKDGKDEFGRILPHDYLESFGDFKPPVYAYLGILPVKIFGLTEFSTRFPSAFFGTLTVLLTYFLTNAIFWKKREKDQHEKLNTISLIAAGMMAISPWHIMLSRAAFEANVATFFLITGVWLFLKSFQEKPLYLIYSAIAFVASIYTFNSARVVAPLLITILAIVNYKELFKIKKSVIISSIVGFILILPIIGFLFSPQAGLRFKEVNIFSDIDLIKASNQEVVNDQNVWWSKIIHNRRLIYGQEFLKHYFDNLSPSFLFISGDANPKFSTQDVGELYLWDLPFIIVGGLYLLKKREHNWWIIPMWLFIGIVPAAFARETPHALRIEGVLPTFQIIIAYGVVQFMYLLKNGNKFIKKYRFPILVAVIMVLVVNMVYFLHGYYCHYPKEYSGEWQYGYQESVNYVKSVEGEYDKVFIGNSLGRPYIYSLFYTKYDPSEFRNDSKIKRDVFGFVHVESFGKYNFPELMPTSKKANEKRLLINDSKSIPGNAHILKTFYLLNKTPVLSAYTL